MLCRTGQEYGYGPRRGFAARQNRVRALRAVAIALALARRRLGARQNLD